MTVRRSLAAALAVGGLCLALPSLVLSSPLTPSRIVLQDDATKAARKGVEQAYKDVSKVAAKKDPDAIFAHCTVDYVFIGTTGETQKLSDRVPAMKQLLAVTESFKVESKIQKFTLNPDGSATAEISEKMNLIAKDPDTGQKHTLSSDSKLEDTWISQDGKWRLRQTKVLSTKAKVDGKETAS